MGRLVSFWLRLDLVRLGRSQYNWNLTAALAHYLSKNLRLKVLKKRLVISTEIWCSLFIVQSLMTIGWFDTLLSFVLVHEMSALSKLNKCRLQLICYWRSPPDDCHERSMKIKIIMTRKRLLILRLLTQFIAAVFPRVACGEAEKWSVVHDDNVDNLDDDDDVNDEDSCLVTCTFHKKALVHTYSRRYIYRCHRLSFCSANITVIRWHCLHRCA